ncbi:MAG: DUF4115 domain-containing protein [Acidobacteria bacterium]|nr:DUF4115 domain-containing protein [Acidobacteriota bacterium]
MQSVGSWLKSAREGRGISLAEISQATKMNVLFLHALEEDRFDRLPGGMFPRAMVRAYARAVGGSEQEIVDIYNQQFPPPAPPPEPPAKSRKPLLRFTASVALLLPLAAGGFVYLKNEMSALHRRALNRPMFSRRQPPPPSLISTEMRQETAPVSRRQPIGLNLQILVLEECWLSLSADGAVVDRRLLRKGEAFSYHADNNFEALVGNAGGVKLVVNGEVWENLGDPYDVKKIRIENDDGKVRLTT